MNRKNTVAMKNHISVLSVLILFSMAEALWALGEGGIQGGGGGSISSLSDTNIVTPADNQALLYDAATGKWVNGDVSSAAGGDMATATWDTDVSNSIDVTRGGTNKASWTLYAIPWVSSSNTFGEIPIGTAAYCLKVNATANGYEWGMCSTGDMSKSVYDTNADGVVDTAALANSVLWSGVSSTPTTLAGYGITNGQPLDADLTTLSAIGNWKIPYSNGLGAVQADLGTGTANQVLVSQGATAVPVWGTVGTAGIADGAVTTAKLAATLTGVDGSTLWDLSGITQSAGVDEGLALPVWANVTPASDKPWVTWDTAGNQFKVYSGGWVTVGGAGGGGGAPTDAQYLMMALDGTLTAERAVTATLPVRFTAASGTSAVVSIDNTSEITRGVVEVATQAETNAGSSTGSVGPLVVTPVTLQAWPGTTNVNTLGTVTSGTWQGGAIADAYVSDTLTASLFVGSGSTTSAVDLATVEVGGTLPVANGGTGGTTQADARTGLGLGTISTQSAGAVAITGGTVAGVAQTGGTINNTPIGGTTAAAGSFTTVTADSITTGTGTDGARRLTMVANTAIAPTAASYELYVEGTAWKANENGTEKAVLLDSNSATITGTSWDFSSVTNMKIPSGAGRTADAAGEVAINTTDSTFHVNTNGNELSVATAGQVSGYVLKTNGSGVLTWEADVSGGTPTLNSIGNPTADTTLAMDAGEEVNFNYTGAFSVGSQFKVEQLTGNPAGGTLFEVKAADTDVTVAKLGDGTNTVNVSQAGNVSLSGTAVIQAGSLVLGDSTPDVAGEIGYASNVVSYHDGTASRTLAALERPQTWTATQTFLQGGDIGAATGTSLAVSGSLAGLVPILTDDLALATADVQGHFDRVTATGTVVISQAAVAGQSFCVYSTTASTVYVDPYGTDVIVLNGTALTGGFRINNSPAAAGDFICLIAGQTNQWITMGRSGTWVSSGS